jgi:predicted CoA-binding protein
VDFTKIKTIAVVGLSSNPARASYGVAYHMQQCGFKIIPINPAEQEIIGEKCYPDLLSIPGEIKIDVVDIFRRSDQVMPIVEQAIAKNPAVIWMQLGVINEEAKDLAEKAGIKVIMDRCIKIDHMHSKH